MKNILLMFSHDVEDVEAIATRALLVRAGLNVVTATFQKSLQIETAFGIKVNVDFNVEELNLDDFVQWCWQQGKHVYLPVIHPFSKGHLLFLHYQPDTELVDNKYQIKEPKLASLKSLYTEG